MPDKTIGIHKLYAKDPVEADKILWGRETDPNCRRGFLKKSALISMGLVLGGNIAFSEKMPAGFIPAKLAFSDDPFSLEGKHEGLTILNDKPWNVETPAHLLDDEVTPMDRLFVRNNGIPPREVDLEKWRLEIDGESVVNKKSYSLSDLKTKFKNYSYQLTLECGGNGRSEFNPAGKGAQWTVGAVGCPLWTGVRLRDVLEDAGVKNDAKYIGYYGKDVHLSGDENVVVISRGVPIEKALRDESLIVWAANGEDLPLQNGYPLRLLFGGWPASTSGKWLTKIVIRNKVHDGPKMEGQSYRVPCEPVVPGSTVPDENMCIIESMPVKSLISFPKSGASIKLNQTLDIRGHAWAGDLSVSKMHTSIDYGSSWQEANLKQAVNRHAWQHWNQSIKFPESGYYEVWARATDSNGKMQPMIVPDWNPKGYLNNAAHRIAVLVK